MICRDRLRNGVEANPMGGHHYKLSVVDFEINIGLVCVCGGGGCGGCRKNDGFAKTDAPSRPLNEENWQNK